MHNKLLWKNSLIRESDRLASDTTDISNGFNTEGFLITMDNEKAFSSLDYIFFTSDLKKFGFSKTFIIWIENLIL